MVLTSDRYESQLLFLFPLLFVLIFVEHYIFLYSPPCLSPPIQPSPLFIWTISCHSLSSTFCSAHAPSSQDFLIFLFQFLTSLTVLFSIFLAPTSVLTPWMYFFLLLKHDTDWLSVRDMLLNVVKRTKNCLDLDWFENDKIVTEKNYWITFRLCRQCNRQNFYFFSALSFTGSSIDTKAVLNFKQDRWRKYQCH